MADRPWTRLKILVDPDAGSCLDSAAFLDSEPRMTRTILALTALIPLIAGCAGGNFAAPATAEDATATGSDAVVAEDASESDATVGEQDAGPQCGEQTGARPSRRSEHVGAFDHKSGKLAMFGGSLAVPENCGFPASTFETETWVYDSKCDLWHEAKGQTPPARARANGVYRDIGAAQYLVVTGGRSRSGKSDPYTLHDDLWAFDFQTEKWLELQQVKTRPKARANATIVYAKKTDSLLLFGGNTSTSGLQIVPQKDAWQHNFATGAWTKLDVTSGPAPRLWAAGTWDNKREQMLVFGGGDASAFANNAKYFNDLWALKVGADGASWQLLGAKSGEKPDRRFWSAMTYDAVNDRYLLFGGHDDGAVGNRNDLWAFTPQSDQWVVIHVADVFNKPANGFCSFPPDFTKMDDFSPERRYAGVFAAGPTDVWLHGGKTDCGVIDDLFRLDLKTYKWHEVTISTVGNSCVRKGGLKCNDYCF